jgi:hypothetical protein
MVCTDTTVPESLKCQRELRINSTQDEVAPVPKHQSHENVHSRESNTTLDVKTLANSTCQINEVIIRHTDQKARWLPRDDSSGPRNRRQTKRVF